jgi:hypothetical protein
MVKITIPLPKDNLARADTESVWAQPRSDGTYVVSNIPFYARGISRGDVVAAEPEDGILKFRRVIQHGGHSTYRIYANQGRAAPAVATLLQALTKLHCEIEPATGELIAVDVLPEADIYEVYSTLEEAERSGAVDFQEGHCGHPLRSER